MPPDSNSTEVRRKRLGALLERQKLGLLVLTKPANVFYLTGFRGSAGVAVVGGGERRLGPRLWPRLWVDPRYTLQARHEARGVEVVEHRGELLKAAGQWLAKRRPGAVGYEDSHLTCRALQALELASGRAVRLKPAGGLVEGLRAVKSAEEIALLRAACRLTAEVFEEVVPLVRPGARECDLAAEVEYRMRRKGAEGAAFETIVASGPRGALPHARASSKQLENGELVILDLGAIVGGYAADMTRTLYLGNASPRVGRLYQAVWEAQREAVESLRPGARVAAVDSAARRVLRRRGLEKYFTHSTGHGVGLEIHEAPRLGRSEKARLKAGSVVTAEPGLYLEGFGGVRLEDTVLVGAGGPEVLTPASKERWWVP